ncbi:MAG: hypothetical protein AAFQ53_16270, partial [Bacteroidota bacterium]
MHTHDGLTDADRDEHDRLVSEVRAADKDTFAAKVQTGIAILALIAFRRRCPAYERARPWPVVAEEDLD